jgi:NAD-dependent dihydropyrimidine dehydrogenase PreA subunit
MALLWQITMPNTANHDEDHMKEEVLESPRIIGYAFNIPIVRDEAVCIGCNSCVEACMNDVHGPNRETGKAPILLHPDDCWYCGSCVMECPLREEGAIKVHWPIRSALGWKRKDTGELYRVDMLNPPAPNMTPPVGGWTPLREPKK